MTTRVIGGVAGLVLCVSAAISLGSPQAAGATRFAVGIAPGADRIAVAQQLRIRGARGVVDLVPIPVLTVSATHAQALLGTPGTRYVERLQSRRQAFEPNDPFLARQWYVAQNRAFDAWPEPPPLAPVRVAVIDSGIDGTHPEFLNRIAASKSFVSGPATVDTQGHGTFVAGLIAAQTNDGVGIAGLAPPAELIIAKVVAPQRTIPVEAEAKAIRWAVQSGARVINMSLAGLRDPGDPDRDTYSQLEADAVAYAVSQGVLVVAAIGNSDQAPTQPWPYASWPAALPHVLGVSALSRTGSSPSFSNRDAQFNDIAAPGEDILSTFPRALTASHPDCLEQGYSSCGPEEYRSAEGTSFAAPQVTAAAAMLFATAPSLTSDQVATLLERSAVDAVPANGCGACVMGRDRFTGAGRLDQLAAVELLRAGKPPRDQYEPNDGAGMSAYPLFGERRQFGATLDYWNDRDDIYRVYLRAGDRLVATTGGENSVRPALALWRPGTQSIDDASAPIRRLALRPPGIGLSYKARFAGWYVLHVSVARPGAGPYLLAVSKSR